MICKKDEKSEILRKYIISSLFLCSFLKLLCFKCIYIYYYIKYLLPGVLCVFGTTSYIIRTRIQHYTRIFQTLNIFNRHLLKIVFFFNFIYSNYPMFGSKHFFKIFQFKFLTSNFYSTYTIITSWFSNISSYFTKIKIC